MGEKINLVRIVAEFHGREKTLIMHDVFPFERLAITLQFNCRITSRCEML